MIKDPVGADSDSEFARLLAPVRSAVSGYHATRDRYWLTRHYVALSTLVTFAIAALDDPAAAMPARAQAAALRANQADLSAATFIDLKYAKPQGFFKRAFHNLTRARLLTRYPHSGIVVDGMLMHSNLSRGLHSEPFDPAGWLLIPIKPAVDPVAALDLLAGTKYDWFSLFAFVLPFRVRDRERLYCYEWCWYAMTGQMPIERVTPEDLAIEALRQK